MKELSLTNQCTNQLFLYWQNSHWFVCFYKQVPHFIICNSGECKPPKTHLYSTLLLWSLKQQMGKMVDPGLSSPPAFPSPSVPALLCQTNSAKELAPSPPWGVSLCGVARAWQSNLWSIGSRGRHVRLQPCGSQCYIQTSALPWHMKKKRETCRGRR